MTSPRSDALDVVVVGGGQAGLGVGYFLRRAGRRFVIMERGRVGETWRSQRWDSFALNTPNWANVLPGDSYRGPEPDGFWTRDELVSTFERYVAHFALPVRTGVTVTAVEHATDGRGFAVRTDAPDGKVIATRAVVIASGILRRPALPALRDNLPEHIAQLHTADYRSPERLPAGAVVVVGSGQSGCQIVEDLLAAGRSVYLCTSKVARLPRRYRGREILEWWRDMGFLDVTLDELEDPAMRHATQPQISGLGRYGHTVSLQQLARDGAILLGRLIDIEDGVLITDGQLVEHVTFADERSAAFKQGVDTYLEEAGLPVPPLENDPADAPAPSGFGHDAPTRLDLAAAGVGSVIWCTGFGADFSWVHLPVLDPDGTPLHRRGVSPVPGLYFLGFPWLHSRKSGVICGVEEDAGYVASAIAAHLD